MKTKLIVTASILFTMSNVYAAQNFSGRSVTVGESYMNCQDITGDTSEQAAELNADKAAANFCDTFGKQETRISEFKYKIGCETRGRGYAIHKIKYVEASADYRCL